MLLVIFISIYKIKCVHLGIEPAGFFKEGGTEGSDGNKPYLQQWLITSYLTSLNLTFLICKIQIVRSTWQSCEKDLMGTLHLNEAPDMHAYAGTSCQRMASISHILCVLRQSPNFQSVLSLILAPIKLINPI